MDTPADRCPYLKPFPAGFDDCPAYQPVQYVALDLRHRPLPPVWSCGHMESARGPEGGYYPRCRLGDRPQREAWVTGMAADQLGRWQEIAREFGNALAGRITDLYTAKGRQVSLLTTGGAELAEAERALRAQVDAFLAEDFALLDARASELEEIGFPTMPMKVVTRAALEDLVRRASASSGWSPPEALLEAFPDRTREFLRGLFTGSTAGDGSG